MKTAFSVLTPTIFSLLFSTYSLANPLDCYREAYRNFTFKLSSEESALLCGGAKDMGPIHCFQQVYTSMELKLNKTEAATLCRGATEASERISCFRSAWQSIDFKLSKNSAIQLCKED